MESERLKPIIEAAVLAAPQPITSVQLAELFDEPERPTPDRIAHALEALAADCADRGIQLVEVGSGYRYQIKAEVFPHLGDLWTERQSRYSRALLETLSLIAYRQPITRGEIEQIRGVAVATSILRTIEEREWVRVVGHRDVPGRPALYGTTKAFLDYFQLRSLDELPPLSALRDLDSLEPELVLELEAPPHRRTVDDAANENMAATSPATDAGPDDHAGAGTDSGPENLLAAHADEAIDDTEVADANADFSDSAEPNTGRD